MASMKTCLVVLCTTILAISLVLQFVSSTQSEEMKDGGYGGEYEGRYGGGGRGGGFGGGFGRGYGGGPHCRYGCCRSYRYGGCYKCCGYATQYPDAQFQDEGN